MPDPQLLPRYRNSWALVIGINKYDHCSPLGYACNDARAVAAILTDKFAFRNSNVVVLLDEQAAKDAIMKALLRHADRSTANQDDRGLIFFAGHGHTAEGRRGEVGYLVPADGDCADLSSLIRWDDLTRNAELLPAKHVLFIMDACYGGLAVTRRLAPGSKRFLKDMLMRYSRQVLTAGKADEVVSDGDGPRPDNSIFTGHLLDALDGAAETKDGILTANGVMAYVYDRVAKDTHSQQTPHYGFIEGDGDFIFSEMPADLLSDDATGGKDLLIDVPAELMAQHEPTTSQNHAELLKEYLSEPRFRIKLDDLVSSSARSAIKKLGPDKMPLSTRAETMAQDFPTRLAAYDEAIRPLQPAAILLGKWGGPDHHAILGNMLARLSDNNVGLKNGLNVWLGLRWYPISFLLYTGGIAAISAGNYEALAAMHTMRIQMDPYDEHSSVELIIRVVEGIQEVHRTELWKTLPGQERHYTPHSEYMYKAAQPVLEDVLFLGGSYEATFDRYEVLRALIVADLCGPRGPFGRFGWKYTSRGTKNNPFNDMCIEAAAKKDHWRPLTAGLFQGSYERFSEIATRFENDVLQKLPWY